MSEFRHYDHGPQLDMENCSACVLLHADHRGPNYAGWPLAFMQSGRRIPTRYHDALLSECDRTDNPAYVENLKTKLKEAGYNLDVLRRSRA
jgi:hypothetical protein